MFAKVAFEIAFGLTRGSCERMKSIRHRWPSALAVLPLAGTFWIYSGSVSAKEVELHVVAGALIGVGEPELSARPTVGGDVSWWWAPHSSLHIGLATGVGLSSLPFGCNDAQPLIGERGGAGCANDLREQFVLLPSALFAARFLLGPRAAVGAHIGTTFIMTGGLQEYLLYPYPTAAIFVESRFGETDRFGLRASLGYIKIAYRESHALLAPTLAFDWR